jgi:hypothetical protein
MHRSGPPCDPAHGGPTPEVWERRETLVLICSGYVLIYVGVFQAVFSDSRLMLALSIVMAVSGVLMAVPPTVAAATSRR